MSGLQAQITRITIYISQAQKHVLDLKACKLVALYIRYWHAGTQSRFGFVCRNRDR